MKRTLFGLTLVGVSALSASGCGLLEPNVREYGIAIDSITGPLVATRGATVEQKLYGPVGANGCADVSEVKVVPQGATTTIEVRARTNGGNCTQMPVYLNGYVLQLSVPNAPAFTVIVKQPDGRRLTRTLAVQ